ncbi:MAG: hypothetical protein HYX72_06555 [Acidobacteria bacterium]|nr:hypothetical protein [Acidobacteriota bacterium]
MRADICAICCGTEREVTVDCPFDCIYLRESRRYDRKRTQPPAGMPFPEVELGDRFVEEHEALIGRIGYELVRYTVENPKIIDKDIEAAFAGLVRTYQTLSSGIYYESAPDEASAVGVFRAIKSFLDDIEKKAREQGLVAGMKESDIIGSLVFLARIAAVHDNGRPRSRAFIDFLRQTFPGAGVKKEEPRLIIPGA